jgi:hypothetical protein
MTERHYLASAAVVLSLVAGSTVASAATIGTNTPQSYAAQHAAYQYRTYRPLYGQPGYYDFYGPQVRQGYGFGPSYEDQWDPYTWSTGNGYY